MVDCTLCQAARCKPHDKWLGWMFENHYSFLFDGHKPGCPNKGDRSLFKVQQRFALYQAEINQKAVDESYDAGRMHDSEHFMDNVDFWASQMAWKDEAKILEVDD